MRIANPEELNINCVPEVSICRPHNLAWLRRPELDTESLMVWEKPNGDLFSCNRDKGEPIIAILKYPRVD